MTNGSSSNGNGDWPWERLEREDVPEIMRQIFARMREMMAADDAGGAYSLSLSRAGDQADGTIVRWRDGEVGFLKREYSTVLKHEEIVIYTANLAPTVKPDDQIEVILTPTELATQFIYSLQMQQACRMSMLLMQATHDVTESDSRGVEMDPAIPSARRQALSHTKPA